uniref:Putative secreted protein n=1 Tax=Ixodes ricinus TaxID=34613 RepID=A0A6B0URP1_IXORI
MATQSHVTAPFLFWLSPFLSATRVCQDWQPGVHFGLFYVCSLFLGETVYHCLRLPGGRPITGRVFDEACLWDFPVVRCQALRGSWQHSSRTETVRGNCCEIPVTSVCHVGKFRGRNAYPAVCWLLETWPANSV